MKLHFNPISSVLFLFVFMTTLLLSCTSKEQQIENTSGAKKQSVPIDKSVTISTFEVNGGWGYDILINDTIYIHQNHVPAVNGMFVFASESEAFRVADVIAEKIHNNVIPPTINQDEMQALGVTFVPVAQ
jgi:Domain of unknown function (DUF4907)